MVVRRINQRKLLAMGVFTCILLFTATLLISPAWPLGTSSGSDGCSWVEHSGGIPYTVTNTAVNTLDEAKKQCEATSRCTGITLSVSDSQRAYFLRDGTYEYEKRKDANDNDLVSWIRVCDDQPSRLKGIKQAPRTVDGLGNLRAWKAPVREGDSSDGDYPFPRDITIPEKNGNGIIYVLYWKETKSGCTWQGLSKICATEDNRVIGFDRIAEASTAQMCETACCNKRGADKLKGKENCAMFQFKEGVGCYHGRSKSDCKKWKSATKESSRGWFGGEVNSDAMENQLRHTRDSRFQEMLKSVRSIRKLMPQGNSGKYAFGVSIVSPAHYVAALEQDKLDALEELDIHIQEVNIPDSLEPDFHSSWFFRTIALPSSPYKKTLQLDSDTILCRSLDQQELWKLLDRYDYAATHAPSLFHDVVQPGEPQSRAMVQYNDAVIAYSWNARTREALARAMESAISLPAFGLRDQAAYREGIWKTYDLHDYGLPPIWQCRVPRSKPNGVTCSNHAGLTQSVMLKSGIETAQKSKSFPADAFVHDTYAQCVILHGHSVTQ